MYFPVSVMVATLLEAATLFLGVGAKGLRNKIFRAPSRKMLVRDKKEKLLKINENEDDRP